MNVFGERQHPEKYIRCVFVVRDGDCVTIHSDNTRTIPGSRHYIHADDVASAVLFPLERTSLNVTMVVQSVLSSYRCR